MSVSKNQNQLRRMATALKDGGQLPTQDATCLADALLRIANGSDANKVFGVASKPGKRKGHKAQVSDTNKQLALAWIAVAHAPVDQGGLGMTLEEACAVAEDTGAFGLTAAVIKKYWNENPEMRRATIHTSDQKVEQWQKEKGIAGKVHELTADEVASLHLDKY